MKKEDDFDRENRSEELRSHKESEGKDRNKDHRKSPKNDDHVAGMDEDMDAQEGGSFGHKSQQQAEEDGRRGENHD